MKTLLCCCAKCENRYIREWIDHYKALGFDNILIYDNNDKDGERFEEVIGDDIESGFVIIRNWREQQKIQLRCYQDCYRRYRNSYDWIAWFDCDEFLEFKEKKTIGQYLSDPRFNSFSLIHVNWMQFDDNDLVFYDPRPVQERFTRPMPYDKQIVYPFSNNNHVKTIARTSAEIRWKHCTPHTPRLLSKDIRCCNDIGIEVNGTSPFCEYDFTMAYLKHYSYKTIEEFAGMKKKRGLPDVRKKHGQRRVKIQNFFLMNEWTEEKQSVADKCLNDISREASEGSACIFRGLSCIFRHTKRA